MLYIKAMTWSLNCDLKTCLKFIKLAETKLNYQRVLMIADVCMIKMEFIMLMEHPVFGQTSKIFKFEILEFKT